MAGPPKNFFSSLLGPVGGGGATPGGLDPIALLSAASPLLTPAPAFSSASSTTPQTATQASPFIIGPDTTAAGDVLRQVVPIAVIGIAGWAAVRLFKR